MMRGSVPKTLEGQEREIAQAGAVSDPRCVPLWYVVRTRSRHEKIVRDQLVGREVETFLPVVERWSRWKDRRKKVAFPLFPGYCFARFPLVERLRILSAVGVADLVGTGGRPEPVPPRDRKSTRLNSSHVRISYAVFCLT